MGVQGLTRFIESRNQEYYAPYRLSSSYVIIDGGIYLSIYHRSNDDPRLGGDCKKMYDITYRYFKRLKECNLTPIVVMGGIPNKKSNKRRSKEDQAIVDCKKYNSKNFQLGDHYGMSVMFRAASFYEALRDLDVFYCRGDFDKECEIFELASKLNCPVISNNSDFFIYDVDFFPWEMVKIYDDTNLDYLECCKFDREKFLREFRVSSLHLPYMAVLFDSDHCKRCLYKILVGKRKRKGKDNLLKALEWLQGETVESAKEKILKSVNESKRKALEEEVDFIFNIYTKSSTTVAHLLQNKFHFKDLKFNIREDDLAKKHDIPMDLMDFARTCKLPLVILEMLTNNSYNLGMRTTMEDITKPSIYAPSIPLVQGIYSLLLRNEDEKPPLKITIREGTQLAVIEKEALPLSNCFLTVKNKKNLLLQILNVNATVYDSILKFFDDGWVMFVLALIFFGRECDVDKIYVHSILLTALTLQILDLYQKDEDDVSMKEIDPDTLNDLLENLDMEDLTKIVKKTMWLDVRKSNRIRLHNITNIHMYMTFQSCLMCLKHIFRLLRLPYEIRISNFVSGSFFYSFSHCLNGALDKDKWIRNWFGENDQLRKLYLAILDNVNEAGVNIDFNRI